MPAEGALRDGTAAGFELIETLRWEPDGGFVRLERHLARLGASAQALGLSHDESAVREVLGGCALRYKTFQSERSCTSSITLHLSVSAWYLT